MTDFTAEEISLVMIARGENRSDTISNIFDILTSPELDPDYKNIAESTVGKLDGMTDDEYAGISFEDGFSEE